MRKEVVYDTFQPKQSEQRSEEWYKDRYGKFTASKINDLLGIKGLGLTGETYAVERAIEQLFGEVEEGFTSKDMQRGIDLEPTAFAKFVEVHPNLKVQNCTFFAYGEHAGASPDGLVDDDAVLEIKCPKGKKFFRLVAEENIDKVYIAQMQMQMLATCRKRAYFFNYLELDGKVYHHTIIVERDEDMIELIKKRLEEAIIIKEDYIKLLESKKQWM
ncbi:lambda exonuclease family protein [Flavobacterium sp.]|jgi:exodeoxyribonuclease (lambda-induced)|uniref:lambda exonuclease family protein n=1 Tax=Flavobacterium sp. TaxID=239 RepID=UPI0025E1C7F4|nr:lambda exonuclease family protein [Flavobacterium sp.]